MQRDHARLIKEWDVLRSVDVKTGKVELGEIGSCVSHVLRRIFPAAGPGSIPPVVLDQTAAAPEVGLMIDARSGSRSVLLFGRDELRRVPGADVDRQEGSDKTHFQSLKDAYSRLQLEIGIFHAIIAAPGF